MRIRDDDRVRVARVRIEYQDGIREIPECWIALNAARNEIGIWLTPDESGPEVTASLDQAIIEWPDVPLAR